MQALRAAPQGGAPFAIALTGYGQPEDRARGLAAGFDRYLVKPISVQVLLELLASLPAASSAAAQADVAQPVSA
jgi:CheY-like chemotaxis protein